MIRRESNVFTKPQNPMSVHNSNWDKTTEERLRELEERMTDIEINILELFKSILKMADNKEVKKEDTKEDVNDLDDEIKETEKMPSLETL